MRRGTRVGQAYIAITADGSGINDDIADSFDDVDYRAIGDDHGKAYADRIRAHLKGLDKDFGGLTDRIGTRLSSRLSKAIETDNALGQGVSRMLATAFDDGKLDELIQHVGRKAGVTFGGEFDREVTRSVLDSLENALLNAARSGNLDLNSILRGIDSGGGQIEIFGPLLDDAVRRVKTAHKEMEADLARSMKEREDIEREGLAANSAIAAKFLAARTRMVQTSLDNEEKLTLAATKAEEKMREAAAKAEAALREKQQKIYDRLRKERDDAERQSIEANANVVRKFVEARVKLFQTAAANEESIRVASAKAEQKLLENQQALYDRLRADKLKEDIAAEKSLWAVREATYKAWVRLDAQRARGQVDDQGNPVSRNRDNGVDLGVVIGKMFGKGSRNNALNALGSSMGNIVSLTMKAGSFASTFADNMKRAGDGASFLQRLMAGFGGGAGGASMFARLGASLPAVAVGIGVVTAAMSIMVSVVGALVGILTALVSTIASALVGALAVAAPAIAAVVAAGGLLVAAFTSMTNAQRAYLTNAFEPFHQAITGLGQIIMTEFTKPLYAGRSAIQVWSANLQKALLPLAGVAQLTARAFADAGNIITASLSGPGFQKFFNALGSELPTIIRRLSVALGAFMNGVGAMFAAIMPYVTQFANHLAKSATAFSNWANSAKGQNSISEFVGRAVESLKVLWRFIKSVGGFLADVFFNPTSQKAGNSIFDSLARAFDGFRRQFNKAARSGDLERWFNDAIKFGGNLWAVIKSLYGTFIALYNSGVLASVGASMQAFATFVDAANVVLAPLVNTIGSALPYAVATAMTPLMALAASVIAIGEAIEWLGEKLGLGNGAENPWRGFSDIKSMWEDAIMPANNGFIGPIAPGRPGGVPLASNFQLPEFNLPDLTIPGADALANTYEMYGGHMPDPVKGTKNPIKSELGQDEWVNPLKDWANSMLSQAEKIADTIRKTAREARAAIRQSVLDSAEGFRKLFGEIGKSFVTTVGDAAKSTDVGSMISSFQSVLDSAGTQMAAVMDQATADAQALIDKAYATRDQMIADAEAKRQSALSAIANARTPKELKAAMALLKQADKDMDLARKQGDQTVAAAHQAAEELINNARASQAQLDMARGILAGQAVWSYSNINNLVSGLSVQNATLADYAEARRIVAEKLANATQALVDAIALRDNYFTAVSDSVKSFGSLLTAQAKTINGVQQALTAGDITDNLRDRLEKVRKFQSDLRLLLAMGLSDSAYKQLVDAGVETGGAYAEAILQGGQGSVSEVNNLTSQMEAEAQRLGATAANHLYQAGVDAAKGLVDGLTSLSAELESAATALGNSIAQAIKNSLGIASPSRVLMDMMNYVGDGAAIGLDNQHVKVSSAAARLSEQISVSPEVAAYAAQQGTSPTVGGEDPVSGNEGNSGDPRFRDLIIQTPTEDPHAVAMETLNEITGRL